MKGSIPFLITNFAALLITSRWLGWVAALVLFAVACLVYWLATKPDKVRPKGRDDVAAEIASETHPDVELAQMRSAYELGGRCSQARRIFTLASVALLALMALVAMIPGLRSSESVDMFAWVPLPFMLAVIAEAFRDIRFRRKSPESHQRFSIWQRADGSASVILYRKAVVRRWLTGKDPPWYAKVSGGDPA